MLLAKWRTPFICILAMTLLVGAWLPSTAVAESVSPVTVEGPLGLTFAVKPADQVPVFKAEPLDVDKAMMEARDTDGPGEAPQFALPEYVRLTPDTDGIWEDVDGRYQVWRTRISAPGALSLNFGFAEFELPKGARLSIYPADLTDVKDVRGFRVFTEWDNKPHGELWTPVVLADDVILELLLPTDARGDYRLELTSINKAFRFLGEQFTDKQGDCNIDVICPEGDPWRAEINSVGVYTVNGTWMCTGAMINNTAQDGTPYFLTANHCGMSTANDQGIVIYWDFASVNCGDLGGGSLTSFQSGSTFLAAAAASDFCLLELDAVPNPDHHVTYAGWDHRSIEFDAAIAIHHPNTDEMAISFENDPTTTTTYLQTAVPGDGTHIRITDWDLGTTEPGSSGSPLFSPDHRIIGQLHGGYAACGNDASDWYGRLSVSWAQVEAWLDPLGSGQLTLDTLDLQATGMGVLPVSGFTAAGDFGGPFSPSSEVFTVTNKGDTPLSFVVGADQTWLTVTGGSGTLAPAASALVTVALNSGAEGLSNGSYVGIVTFTNTTDGDGDATRQINLNVGIPQLVYSFPLDTDPGWTMTNLWGFGVPQGSGGDHGNPDPTSGHTGANVLGYNLAGDYQANLPETHMTSTAIDCSNLSAVTLKFWRYLNVEQPRYDHASIYASSDGANYTQIWTNGAEYADAAWSQESFDISAVADGQATVYLRWTMGATDDTWFYSGWNVDDVEIWGLVSGESPGPDVPEYQLGVGNYPNPFNPLTRIEFTLEKTGPALVQVYDLQGRLVRSLIQESLPAGHHQVIWDGRTRDGRRAASGVYFARLVAGGRMAEHKMVLLK